MDLLSSVNGLGEFSLIERHKKELNDSIRYASYIQKALLPSQNEIDRYFPQNFILYLPKDVVSGDFYWFYRLKNKILFAVADCTGHGVPGAFMSVLGISILNQIVLSHKNISAGGILDLLREHVMKSLHQTGTSGEQKDGMDIALCILDLSTSQLQFAGAYNPLYLIRKGKLINFPGDRMPIGIDPIEEKPFKNHDIILKNDDMLYLFSDGFADQFGGEKGKKFKYKPFRELLISASKLAIQDQKNVIHQAFHEWKWSHGQVDDILIMGIHYTVQ